jgi:hypothetical protein
LGVVVSAAPVMKASERWETLEAIHAIENPTDLTSPGPHGELGAYQFRRTTWAMHTTKAFSQALVREQSDMVAVKHYEWIREGLVRNGFEATPYNIALAWNGGLDATVKGHAPRSSKAYAARVTNIVEELKKNQMASK